MTFMYSLVFYCQNTVEYIYYGKEWLRFRLTNPSLSHPSPHSPPPSLKPSDNQVQTFTAGLLSSLPPMSPSCCCCHCCCCCCCCPALLPSAGRKRKLKSWLWRVHTVGTQSFSGWEEMGTTGLSEADYLLILVLNEPSSYLLVGHFKEFERWLLQGGRCLFDVLSRLRVLIGQKISDLCDLLLQLGALWMGGTGRMNKQSWNEMFMGQINSAAANHSFTVLIYFTSSAGSWSLNSSILDSVSWTIPSAMLTASTRSYTQENTVRKLKTWGISTLLLPHTWSR